MEALIVGRSVSLMWPQPALLSRAGFTVDVIATSGLLRASKFVRRVDRAASNEEMLRLAYERICSRIAPYDWVIACDDDTVRDLSRMAWPKGSEPKHLPLSTAQPSHIYSKIGLSKVLSAAGVKTPQFRVAANCREAVAAANAMEYPVLVKADSGNGGDRVWDCRSDLEMWKLEGLFGSGPMLVQRRIEGQEVDLSAIYFERKLVHFAYSKVERALPRFGPSVVRRYFPLALVAGEVFDELAALGEALDADGFVTIGCMDAKDGSGRYYFEADMRTNVWVDFSRFYGEDAAVRVREWFLSGASLRKDDAGIAADCVPVTIPYFQRVALWELMLNRYDVWKFIPWTDSRVMLSMLCSLLVMPVARAVAPPKFRQIVKRGMLAAGVPFP